MAELVLSNSKSTAKIQGFPALHGITTRKFVNFGINENPMERENNLLLMKSVRANTFCKIITNHQGRILQANLNGRVDNYLTGDALFCLRPKNGLRPVLIANTADCPIIFLTDIDRSFIGIIHSGRVETEMNLVGGAINKLIKAFDIPPENIIVGLWPGICQYCYPVNFRQEILGQLLDAELDGLNIHTADKVCSAHYCLKNEPLFSSYRRDRNGERNAAFITF